jgi:hypothetical protein
MLCVRTATFVAPGCIRISRDNALTLRAVAADGGEVASSVSTADATPHGIDNADQCR